MATYTAVFHINLSVEFEADDHDDAMEKLDGLDYSSVDANARVDDFEWEFDYLIDDEGNEFC